MLKCSDIPTSFVSGAAGPRSVASFTRGLTEFGTSAGLLVDTVPMRSWTTAEAAGTLKPANPATQMAEVSKSRGREEPSMRKSFCSIEFYQAYAAQKNAAAEAGEDTATTERQISLPCLQG